MPLIRIFCIVNPTGGGGKGRKWLPELSRRLRQLCDEQQAEAAAALANEGGGAVADNAAASGVVSGEAVVASASPPSAVFPPLRIEQTTTAGEGARLGALAVQGRYDVVVVVGGDGTLSEVVHGVFSEMHTNASRPATPPGTGAVAPAPPLALGAVAAAARPPRFVYCAAGTGADFAKLGCCVSSVDDCIRAIVAPKVTNVDVCCVTPMGPPQPTGSPAGAPSRRFFINVASVGLSHSVVVRAEALKRTCIAWFGGTIVFFVASFIELIMMRPRALLLRPLARGVDDSLVPVLNVLSPVRSEGSAGSDAGLLGHVAPSAANAEAEPHCAIPILPEDAAEDGGIARLPTGEGHIEGTGWLAVSATTVAFCNGRFFGGGMKVGPDADPTDHVLGVTIWRATFCGFLCRLLSVYNGRHTKWKSTTTLQGPAFEIRANVPPPPPTQSAGELQPLSSPQVFFEIDGEKACPLPAVVSVVSHVAMCSPAPPVAGTTAAAESNKRR